MLKRLSFLLFSLLSFFALAQSRSVNTEFLLTEIHGNSTQQLSLADGSLWRLSSARALSSGSAILLTGRNLRSGTITAYNSGFSFDVQYLSGSPAMQSGVKTQLISTQNDGKILILANNQQAIVVDTDRLYSRHFRGPSEVIVSADSQQLVYIPSLTKVNIRLLPSSN